VKLKTIVLCAVASIALAACGRTVPAGHVGIKVNDYGQGAGVQSVPLPTGWHGTGIGEHIVLFPTTQTVYPFSHDSREGSPVNEEIQFTDSNGVNISGDIALTIRVDPTKAPSLYSKYRMSVNDLIYGPLRTALRSAMNVESEKMTSEQIYQGGKQILLDAAKGDVQRRYAAEGIEVISLDWLNPLRFPPQIQEAMTLKTAKLQLAQAAQADQQRAEAQAKVQVAQAQGEADAMRIRGQAISSNPQILQQAWIEKWDGHLPTYMTNGQSTMLVTPKD
jgi:regulator of protease activity HflC (stomatin/prohibitin superfamily)